MCACVFFFYVTGKEAIDMTRMKNILERNILEYLSSLESNPHDAVAFLIIGDVLYGNTPEDVRFLCFNFSIVNLNFAKMCMCWFLKFDMRLNVTKQLEHLQGVDDAYWVNLLKQYLIEGHSIVIRASPSIDEQKRMAKEEMDRIEKQRDELGAEGLATKENELVDAMGVNAILPPNEMLTQVPIPSPDSIHFHPVKKYCSNEIDHPPGFDVNALPCYAEAFDIHTNFVYVRFLPHPTIRLDFDHTIG